MHGQVKRKCTCPKTSASKSSCQALVTLLLHCCYIVVTRLLYCYYTIITLWLHCCYIVAQLLLKYMSEPILIYFNLSESIFKHEYLYFYLSEGCVYFWHLCLQVCAKTCQGRHVLQQMFIWNILSCVKCNKMGIVMNLEQTVHSPSVPCQVI